MQIKLCCGLQHVVKRLSFCGKPSYRHPKHLWGDLLEKFKIDGFKYANLC